MGVFHDHVYLVLMAAVSCMWVKHHRMWTMTNSIMT